MDHVGHIYTMPHKPLQLVTIFKIFACNTCYTLQQKMCMAKNGFNTTTVWSAGNSDVFKENTHAVGACHLTRCTHAIFDVVPKCIATVSLRFLPSLKDTTTVYL